MVTFSEDANISPSSKLTIPKSLSHIPDNEADEEVVTLPIPRGSGITPAVWSRYDHVTKVAMIDLFSKDAEKEE